MPAAKHQITAQIAASTQRVWEVLADVESWPSWTQSVTSVKRLDAGPLRIGSRARIKQPQLPVTTWTVTEVTEGRSFTWQATGPGVRTTASHRVGPTESGSIATLTLSQHGAAGRLIGWLTRGLTERYLAMEAEGLRREATASGRGAPNT